MSLINLIIILFVSVSNIKNGSAVFEDLTEKIIPIIKNEASLVNIAKKIIHHEDIVNTECEEDLWNVILPKELWAIKMIDSGGGIPHGLLKYNTHSMGQYGECIETSYKRSSGGEGVGRHCFLRIDTNIQPPLREWERNYHDLSLPITNIKSKNSNRFITRNGDKSGVSYNIGICLPSACTVSKINQILSSAYNSTSISIQFDELTCTVDKKSVELSAGDIVAILFLVLVGFIMLCSTVYDIWLQKIKKGNKNDQSQLFIVFSVYTNSKKLFTPSKNPGPLACLHGIRVITICWIVLGHRYAYTFQTPQENLSDMFEWTKNPSSAMLLGGHVSVDTFFLMSGILLSYVFFKSAKKENIGRDLPMFYIHRILRLTPLLAVIVFMHATLLSHYGNGPLKYYSDYLIVDSCVKEWWSTLLYVQNYVGEYICVGQSWYLAVDMQLYIISPLFLYPLLWNRTFGLFWLSLCIVGTQVIAVAIAFTNTWFAGFVFFGKSPTMMIDFYIPTHTRATPYFIGMMAGYLLYEFFKKNNITTIQYKFLQESPQKQLIILLCWASSLALLAAVIFGSYPLNQIGHVFSKLEDSMYLSFGKIAWTIGLLGMIVLCACGYGGPINWFLSLTMFEILGRFTYSVYLTHMTIQILLVYTANFVPVFSHLNTIYSFFGDLMASFAISYVLILAFESPVAALEKIIFKKGKPATKEQPTAVDQIVTISEEIQSEVKNDNNKVKYG